MLSAFVVLFAKPRFFSGVFVRLHLNKLLLKIHSISGPRNISTALMYSFAQRPDTSVVDEPFYGYYLKHTGTRHPGREETLQTMPTDLDVILSETFNQTYKTPHVFFKNMAHHLIDVPLRFLSGCTNILLIRDPKQLIQSFTKVIKNPTLRDIGLKHEWELFQYISNKTGCEPVVIDSGELLKDPETYLKRVCEKLGILFDDRMLSWPAGARPEDGIWAKHWYNTVHKSTGFAKHSTTDVLLDNRYKRLYEEAMPFYENLFNHAIKQ